MVVRALALDSGVTGLEDHRLLVGALLGGVESAWSLDRRPGLLGGAGDPAAISGTGMVATVNPFAAVIPGGSSPTQGPYLVVATDTAEVALPDGDPSAPRTDTIGIVVRDDVYDLLGSVSVEVRVITGEDETALPLWDVTVPQGASAGDGGIPWSSAVTDRRTYTAAHGGVIPVPDMASRNRLTAVRDGTLCHVHATDGLYMRVPTGWTPAAGQPLYDALAGIFQQQPGPWVQVQLAAGLTGTVEVCRTANGLVYMRGTFTTGGTDINGQDLGQLPSGFHPDQLYRWSTASAQSGGNNSARLEVGTSGYIRAYSTYEPSWVSAGNAHWWTS